jgi:hypothetical protein
MNNLKTVEETAHHLLQEDVDSVVRFRLLRDVLKISSDNGILLESHRELLQSRWA